MPGGRLPIIYIYGKINFGFLEKKIKIPLKPNKDKGCRELKGMNDKN